jgi:hypothetical protein
MVVTNRTDFAGPEINEWIAAFVFFSPQVIITLTARHKLYAAISAVLLFIFSMIIAFNPIMEMQLSNDDVVGYSWLFIASVLPLIALMVGSAKAVSRRLIFLALGLLLLIGLNELSKLGLDLTAPKAL